jgi:hypothetical protein
MLPFPSSPMFKTKKTLKNEEKKWKMREDEDM